MFLPHVPPAPRGGGAADSHLSMERM
jgi:hypothetical protein